MDKTSQQESGSGESQANEVRDKDKLDPRNYRAPQMERDMSANTRFKA
jgi:hypothetical protein